MARAAPRPGTRIAPFQAERQAGATEARELDERMLQCTARRSVSTTSSRTSAREHEPTGREVRRCTPFWVGLRPTRRSGRTDSERRAGSAAAPAGGGASLCIMGSRIFSPGSTPGSNRNGDAMSEWQLMQSAFMALGAAGARDAGVERSRRGPR